jgi:hypothetical protein
MGRYDLRFDSVETPGEVRQLRDFMLAHREGYDPLTHEAWVVERCIPAIEAGERPALAWWRAGRIAGDGILKVAGQNVVELCNFRVAGGWLEGRGAARFMLNQLLTEAIILLDRTGAITPNATSIRMRLDTAAGGPAQSFFEHAAFTVMDVQELYRPGYPDVIMEREIQLP